MSGHTPGPWRAVLVLKESKDDQVYVDCGWGVVAVDPMRGRIDSALTGMSEADATLCSFAPDLLHRLKVMCREWREAFGGPEENRTPGDCLELSEALIAKVEGRA